jgi:hypothetical protein
VKKVERQFLKVSDENGVTVSPELLKLKFGEHLEAFDMDMFDAPAVMLRADQSTTFAQIGNLSVTELQPSDVYRLYPVLSHRLRRA